MFVDSVYILSKECNHFNYEMFGLMYIALYEKYGDLKESMPDEWMANYNAYCDKLEYMERILLYCTDIIEDFDSCSDRDLKKIMDLILLSQHKYGGIKRLKLQKILEI